MLIQYQVLRELKIMKTRVTYYYPAPQHFNPILYPDTSNFLNDFRFMRKSIKIDGLDIVRLLFLTTSSQHCCGFLAITVQSNFSFKEIKRHLRLLLRNQLVTSGVNCDFPEDGQKDQHFSGFHSMSVNSQFAWNKAVFSKLTE